MTANHAHTPTVTQIREDYAHLRYHFADGWSIGEERVQFDNWLTAEIAAAEQRGKEQGWDEVITAQIQRLTSGDPDVERFQMPANPYRADRLEGDDEKH